MFSRSADDMGLRVTINVLRNVSMMENIFTIDMFEKSESEKLDTLKEQATADKQVADRPVSEKVEVVEESVEQQIAQSEPGNLQDSSLFNNYMEELNRT